MLYFDVFNSSYISKTARTGIVTPSDINYLRRLYIFNKDQIENYYQSKNFSVKNTNILSRIIEHLPVQRQLDVYSYLEYASPRIRYLNRHFKFTTDESKGLVHNSYFFGNDAQEIILADYSHFNAYTYVKDWKKQNIIKVLKHPRNDLKMLLPLGKNDGSKSGLDVVLVDTTKLALKYREFIKEVLLTPEDLRVGVSKNNFVLKYVLSLTLADITDHSLLNKLMCRYKNQETITPTLKHRFKIYEPTTQIDRYLDYTLDVITSKKLDFVNLLRCIKLLFNEDASELLAIPDVGATRQVKWALLASRLEHMVFIYDVCKDKSKNKHYINDWKRLVKRMQGEGMYLDMFDYTTRSELVSYMDRIKDM